MNADDTVIIVELAINERHWRKNVKHYMMIKIKWFCL